MLDQSVRFPKLKFLVTLLGAVVIILTFIPYISTEHWSIRVFDFPHLQLTIFTALILLALVFLFNKRRVKDYILTIALLACLIYQGTKILPYTVLGKVEVDNASAKTKETLSIYTANVLQDNRDVKSLIKDTKKFNADVVLYTETNSKWTESLNEYLNKEYRYTVQVPQENTYGMLLYSKFELEQSTIEYLVEDTIPSIHTRLILPSDKTIQLYAIHPAPPTPIHNPSSLDRDAELMKVGRLSKNSEFPVIVMGDFNDVAWSETTSLFQSYSGLLDLRKGRGLFNTYNAKYWFMRWPLDHVFVSPDFRVLEVDLGSNIGSDHFPFFTKLSLESSTASKQRLPSPSKEVIDDATEQIREEKEEEGS
ncbi:hypothetical protein HME9304_00256 [Flagellimonas maritima]|uniref:Endonuclease/exonuclease/phosphatase domain-containing protein n=1 Tax=Flagellimonas maritima TaxID=1383885 RepID=A0A2Z4LNF9_9FLAO|nr:endonuclease/exonuclease/phosphatase family protein [Allomuricauda aurantiaca]AWX43269.1 hypothetical protein HME9304_00256 [Allomuricauda aurantiaca]